MKNKVTLLLLTCGTNACYHTAKRLRECYGNRIRIIGTDINKGWMVSTFPSLDMFYQCPFTTDDSYYPFILDICQKEHVNYIMPSFDADQKLFYKGNSDLEKMGVMSLGVSKDVLKFYCTKEKTNGYLQLHNLPIPQCYSVEEIDPNKLYFCKPLNGVGSVGARKMMGDEILNGDIKDLIIEEICQEPEITLECFNYDGKIYSVARERLGTISGVCTKARVFYDDYLATVAQQFADTIELPHIFNLQFMKTTNDEWVITDVNLRTAGGMSISYAAGWDEVEALGKILFDEEGVVLSVKKKIKEQYVIRAYTDIVTKQIEERIAFDFDGTLLDSRKRHQTVMVHVLKDIGIDLNASDLVPYKAEGHNNMEWLLSKGIPEKEAKSINKKWVELIEDDKYLREDVLYPDIINILKTLSLNNSLVLITARNNVEGVEKQIERLGIKQYFEKVIVVETSPQTPEMKAKKLNDMNVKEFHGDTENDMKAAKLAGCEFYATTRGFRSETFWGKYDVKYSKILTGLQFEGK